MSKIARTFSCLQVIDQLTALGIKPDSVLIVHCAFSKVRPIENGPAGLIAALRQALGDDGTLVMPSMTDDDDSPFDPTLTPCKGMGIVADTFWRLPGVLRSNSPHSFSAMGPKAAEITTDHPVDIPHGLDSPVGRAWQMDAQILLLGIGHEANTTMHLAENMAGVRYHLPSRAMIMINGSPRLIDYAEVDHCCLNFAKMDNWLSAEGVQKIGKIGYAHARLVTARDIVETATSRLRENETVFLHSPGVCNECDEARASIAN